MDLTHFRHSLVGLVHQGLHRQDGHGAELDQLIEALKKKDADLEQRLGQERDPIKRRHIKIELQVTRLQYRKGLARRLELQTSGG